MNDTPTEREAESNWTRLRRRKVVQWGLAYAAGAWVLLQVLGFAADAFGWPAIAKQLAMMGLGVGLPIAVALAWFHGDRGHQRVTGPELAVLTLLLFLGGGLLFLYAQRSGPTTPTTAAAMPAPASAVTDAGPSIAVLPFENRSRLEDDVYFVDGIHDDILTQLSKVGALKVISRTSVEQFRDTKLPMKAVADQLGVTKILEGGVQRAGDRVRINVQLIDARTDTHLWAESYDRELTAENVFAIQSEVASSIAHALQATLTPSEQERIATRPTRSLEAWTDYQLGRRRLEQRNSTALAEAETFFQKAIDRDPEFALAYVGLGETLRVQLGGNPVPLKETMARAEAAAAKALALDANIGAAHAIAAALAQERREFVRAEKGFRTAIELDPNYATAHLWYGFLLQRLGRNAEAVRQMETAAELDPLWSRAQSMLAASLADLGRLDEALQHLDRAIEIDPSVAASYAQRGHILAYGLNRWVEGISWRERAVVRDPGSPSNLAERAVMHAELANDAEAARWIERARSLGVEGRHAHWAATLYHAYRGEFASSENSAERLLAIRPFSTDALLILRDADLRAGRLSRARARYASAYPELLVREVPTLDRSSVLAAIDLALVLQGTGEKARAELLLDRAGAFFQTIGAVRDFRGSFADAQIQTLRGRRTEALAALRQAEQQGRRAGWRYHRDFDPNLASIRDEPEFKAVFADIERDMAQQRARLAARPKDAPLELSATTH